ncbi:MAG: DUF1501 domain-containing protein [Acidobacteria bacterium]|nr:DUF1501 domain-containing protein [Acidobacteriota bacterium]
MALARRELLQAAFGLLGNLGVGAAMGHYTGQRTPGKAKRVISLFLAGGPSQVDLFDPKPLLVKYQGQRPGGVELRTERQTGGLMPTPFSFSRRGRNGVEVSDILPRLGAVIDEISVIRSMYSFNPTHTPASSLYHTGTILANRPSIGSWVSYGLGAENQNLPSFVALNANGPAARSAFLPAEHQGMPLNTADLEPEKMIPNLRNRALDAAAQQRQLDAVQALNRRFNESFGPDDYLSGRIASMEAAYRMQFAATDAFDIRKESAETRALYGETPLGNSCLLARRLVERGVRFVSVGSGDWDDHKGIEAAYKKKIPAMDQAAAGLITDLKRRGMLEETLVVWGGEFGRTPVSESGTGRDHNPYGFTMWVAGGGFRGGIAHGATDDFGFKAVESRVSIHDLHATMLYALGLDHTQLTYRYAGRDFRLTDVFGTVVKGVLA